jgi:hypothetical protein
MPTANGFQPFVGVAGLAIIWSLGCDPNLKLGSANDLTWGAFGAKFGIAGSSTDYVATLNATVSISQSSLVLGNQPLRFPNVHIGDDIRRCQRFLCKSYDLATNPGTASTTNGQAAFINPGAGTTSAQGYCPLPVPMAKVPTVTIYDLTTGTSGTARNVGNNTQATGVTAPGVGEGGFSSDIIL